MILTWLWLAGCGDAAPLNDAHVASGDAQPDTLAQVDYQQIAISMTVTRLGAPPPSPSNRIADDPAARAFGEKLFFDQRLSRDGSLSCASCHRPELAFTDGLARGQGIEAAGRNTQTLIGAGYQTWWYWDGRKDSLWAQGLVPIEAPKEMGSTRVQALRLISADPDYRKRYVALFGSLPHVVSKAAIDVRASPWGDSAARAAWQQISSADKQQINGAYANLGKVLAAYQRTLPIPQTPFDQYAAALAVGATPPDSFSKAAEQGMRLFMDPNATHCLRCHNGPLFSNGDFHNIGSGNFSGADLDFGRMLGIAGVTQDEFNCLGPYSDAPAQACSALRFLATQVHGDAQGAFKTPTLRQLTLTAPYFHDGRYPNLTQVIEHYRLPQAPESELQPLQISDTQRDQLVAFLHALSQP